MSLFDVKRFGVLAAALYIDPRPTHHKIGNVHTKVMEGIESRDGREEGKVPYKSGLHKAKSVFSLLDSFSLQFYRRGG